MHEGINKLRKELEAIINDPPKDPTGGDHQNLVRIIAAVEAVKKEKLETLDRISCTALITMANAEAERQQMVR